MRSDLNTACFQPVWSETHRGTCKDSSPSGRRRRDGREGGTGERLEWRGKFALQATFARWIYLDQELLFYPSVWEKWPPSHHDHLLVNVLWCRLKPGSLFDCGYEIWRWKHVGLCCAAARPPAPPSICSLFCRYFSVSGDDYRSCSWLTIHLPGNTTLRGSQRCQEFP